MEFKQFFPGKGQRPYYMAGPCSAETEEQVMQTARELAAAGIDLFRAGIWKPRTRPNSFEGVGSKGLEWLQNVKRETGLKVATEVANHQHVEEALKHDIDVLWIGARTTVSPFSVQEIADALHGVDIPVLIKNPINPDLKLWMGAIERIYESGIHQLGVVHRGFSLYGFGKYRNQPCWEIAIELKRQFPEMMFICDSSHICGNRDLLEPVSQKALDLNYDGIMLEVHPTPDEAWSDAEQQITPAVFTEIKNRLIFRRPTTDDKAFLQRLEGLRRQIDQVDDEILELLSSRMSLAEKIGTFKKQNNISILQTAHWNDLLERMLEKGGEKGLSPEFIHAFLNAIHQESINHQHKVMNE